MVTRTRAPRCQPPCATAEDVPAAGPIDRSTAGTCGHSQTAIYAHSPAYTQADPLRKPTCEQRVAWQSNPAGRTREVFTF